MRTLNEKIKAAFEKTLEICKKYNINFYDIDSRSARRNHVLKRKFIVQQLYENGFSSVVIGKLLKRDHSTVLYLKDCPKVDPSSLKEEIKIHELPEKSPIRSRKKRCKYKGDRYEDDPRAR